MIGLGFAPERKRRFFKRGRNFWDNLGLMEKEGWPVLWLRTPTLIMPFLAFSFFFPPSFLQPLSGGWFN
jgi:hypothetical protein